MFWLTLPALAAVIYWICREQALQANLDLEKDGVLLLPNCQPEEVLALLPEGYEFLDYRYSITGCALSTFHRDVTSSPYVFKSQHPIYTLICYGSKGEMLSVVPGSHRHTPFVWNTAKTINSEQAESVLFHCDILHAGVISRDSSRQAVQFKIAHKDDLHLLTELQGIDVNKQESNSVPLFYEWLCRKLSLMFPFLINHVFTRYLQKQDESLLNRFLLTVFGRSFYNR
ncbi:MAG: hypothetical protein MI746_15200 [Pseudomonadales bacterium]|nr:hypothetical protein [Pseudomonadales bacterium]